MQDKLLRTLVLNCICQCCTTYLYRLHSQQSKDKAAKWLASAVKPVLTNLRKGNFQFPEQQVILTA